MMLYSHVLKPSKIRLHIQCIQYEIYPRSSHTLGVQLTINTQHVWDIFSFSLFIWIENSIGQHRDLFVENHNDKESLGIGMYEIFLSIAKNLVLFCV